MTELYQYNTLAALMAGLYEGTLTMAELLQKGNFGIGTLDGIDGELIVLDGKAYQARGDKSLVEVADDALTPYAAVTNFVTQTEFTESSPISAVDLDEKICQTFTGENLFQAVKITGKFSKMHVRMAPGAEERTPFVEVARNQPEYTEEDQSGTIVGFWTPEMFHGVSVAGFHLHFINDEHNFGGHVLGFELENGKVELAQVDQLVQAFPVKNQNFLKANFNLKQLRQDIDEAE